MTYMRVCDACKKPVDQADEFVEVVGPAGQRHYHDDAICWPTVRAAILAGENDAKAKRSAASAVPAP